jgi:hypothetical protein
MTPTGDKEFMKPAIYPPLAALTSSLENTPMIRLNNKGGERVPLPKAFARLEIRANLIINLNRYRSTLNQTHYPPNPFNPKASRQKHFFKKLSVHPIISFFIV